MNLPPLISLQNRLEADLSEVCGHLNVLHERMVSLTREALETAAWEGQGLNTPAGGWRGKPVSPRNGRSRL